MQAPTKAHKVANFVAFQGAWFACVLGAAHDTAWLGPAVVTGALALHFAWSARPARQAYRGEAATKKRDASDAATGQEASISGASRHPGSTDVRENLRRTTRSTYREAYRGEAATKEQPPGRRTPAGRHPSRDRPEASISGASRHPGNHAVRRNLRRTTRSTCREAQMIAGVAALGFAADSALTAAGVLRFTGGGLLAPLWIAALWVAFASTLDCSMRWLRRRWLLGALLGAAAGPLCYLAGARLGALALHPEGVRFAVSLALAWGLALPAGLWIVERTVDS